MKIKVTLRYRSSASVSAVIEKEAAEGTTAGNLTAEIIREYEEQEGITFTGVNVAILLNGMLIDGNHQLHDGDELVVIPVAAGG